MQIPKINNYYNFNKYTSFKNNDKKQNQAAEISRLRLATSFLTDEQIAKINKEGTLPDNAKFIFDGFDCSYYVANNFFGIRAGSKELPEGFEVKKNIIGQARAVPQHTKITLIK
ncbi:hypothetical protein IJD34_02470 [bacterium]|nr:hypothetical protein [bacterium]